MKRKPFLIVLALVVACVFGYWYLNNNNSKEDSIRIGAILPLTGDIASYGINSKNGLDLAISIINSNNSNKHKITIDYQDSKGSAKEAVSIMQNFCSNNKYPIVIGEAASSNSLAMIPIANKTKTFQISPVSSSPELSMDDYFFRVCPSDAFQAFVSANWMKSDGVKRVGIIYVNNSWGNSLKDEFIKTFKINGGSVNTIEAINEGNKDFKTIISKLLKANINAIYCPTYGKEGGIILKQLKELGNKLPIYGADVWSSPELITTAKNSAEGIKIVKPSELFNDSYSKFKKAYIKKYNIEPDVYAAYSYDIMMIISDALEKNNLSGEKIKNYISNLYSYEGVTGETKFDSNGDCNSKPFIKQIIKNEKYENVE
jgi:branched-chain amino acid transport system substrate-binding protein